LVNQARLTAKALEKAGIAHTKVVRVHDSNGIDREVHHYRPDYVMIEAIWAPPYKMRELVKLHPNVIWNIRIHSNMPFFATEGIAFPWAYEYLTISDKIHISANHPKIVSDLNTVLPTSVYHLPNIYGVKHGILPFVEDLATGISSLLKRHIDIGCFGAIRPLKNHVVQAIAAIQFGNDIGKPIRFHINAGRVEQYGENILKNLRAVFAHNEPHELVEHGWYEYDEFLDVVKKMEIGMQVSLTETFNIVTADFVSHHVPVVVSKEVDWLPIDCQVSDATDASSIASTLQEVYMNPGQAAENRLALIEYDESSLEFWEAYLGEEKCEE
jgi:hypothetical protein